MRVVNNGKKVTILIVRFGLPHLLATPIVMTHAVLIAHALAQHHTHNGNSRAMRMGYVL